MLELGSAEAVDASGRGSKLECMASARGDVQVAPVEDFGCHSSGEPAQAEAAQERSSPDLDSGGEQLRFFGHEFDFADAHNALATRVDYLSVQHVLGEQKLVGRASLLAILELRGSDF